MDASKDKEEASGKTIVAMVSIHFGFLIENRYNTATLYLSSTDNGFQLSFSVSKCPSINPRFQDGAIGS